jgi:hypothetical protein
MRFRVSCEKIESNTGVVGLEWTMLKEDGGGEVCLPGEWDWDVRKGSS